MFIERTVFHHLRIADMSEISTRNLITEEQLNWIASYARKHDPANRGVEALFNISVSQDKENKEYSVTHIDPTSQSALRVILTPAEFPFYIQVRLFPNFRYTSIDISSIEVPLFLEVFKRCLDPEGIFEVRTNARTLKEIQITMLGEAHLHRFTRVLNSLMLKLLSLPNTKALLEINKDTCEHCLNFMKEVQFQTDLIPSNVAFEGWDDWDPVDQERTRIGNALIRVGHLAQRMIYQVSRDHHFLYKKINAQNESFAKVLTDLNSFLHELKKTDTNNLKNFCKNLPRDQQRRFVGLFRPLTQPNPHDLYHKLDLLAEFFSMELSEVTDKYWGRRQRSLVQNCEENKAHRLVVAAGAAHLIQHDENQIDPIIAQDFTRRSVSYMIVSPNVRALQYITLLNRRLLISTPDRRCGSSAQIDFSNPAFTSTYENAGQILRDVNAKLCRLNEVLASRYPEGQYVASPGSLNKRSVNRSFNKK